MSRKIVRVEIPSKRPEDLLALGQSLYAKHVADGDASPLDADKMTTLNNQATVADTQNKSAKLHDAQAQTARQVRDTSLGIADGQSAQTDGTVLALTLPVVALPKWLQVVLCVVVWFAASAGFGYLGHRMSLDRFDHDTWWSRLRGPERSGRLYERLGIKRWKDRLPEAGALYSGGFSKRDLRAHDRAHLERFVVETRRAEFVHWLVFATVLVFPLFVVWYALPPNLVYAVVANLPFIAIQRYNRARLLRILARLDARADR
mgnify:CR=1 FL=1